jgi:hypothetical protein
MITDRLRETLALIAGFCNGCRHGYEGFEGYRKSTDLYKFEVEREAVSDARWE